MSSNAKNYNKWYEKNKEEFNARRRAKYKEDPEYRERIKGYRNGSEDNRGINRTKKSRHQKGNPNK